MLRCCLTASEHLCPQLPNGPGASIPPSSSLLSQHSRPLAYIWQFAKSPSGTSLLTQPPLQQGSRIGATCIAHLHHARNHLTSNVQATHIDITRSAADG